MFLVDHDQAGAQQWCEDGRAGANDDPRCSAACEVPGIATPGEAFAALAAGADALKLFPGEALPPPVVKAWRAVLPKDLWLLPVGGIGPESLAPYLEAGANGFGIGSALYKAGRDIADIESRAKTFVEAYLGCKK